MHISSLVKPISLSIILCSFINAKDIEELNEITVTANKVEENILKVPQSITVLDKETIKEKNINTISKVINEIPNMSSTNISGMGTFTNFRGINTSTFNMFSSPIVVYIDGIPIVNRYEYEALLVNVKRIEILRGPQGTLYGKDSIGAVINIVTEDTPKEPTAYLNIEHGDNNYLKTKFNFASSLIEKKLYAGINGELKSDDGNLTNHFNNDKKAGKSWQNNFNLFFKYLPTENLNLKLNLNKLKSKVNGSSSATYTSSLDSLNQSKPEDVENINYEVPTNETKGITSQSLSINYNFDKVNLDWVMTHKKTNFDGIYDMDFSNNTIYDNVTQYNNFTTKTYSNEIRLSNKNNNFEWIGGIYLDYEKFKESTGYGNYLSYGTYDASGEIKSKTQAIFGQIIFPLYDSFDLTLGGRYQKIKKDAKINVSIENYPSNNYNFTSEKTWNSFLPKIALSYKKNEKFVPFLSISKGYMPGGFNTFPNSSANDNTYESQQSINYELGIKGYYNDLDYSASLFYMDIKNLQVYRVDGSTGSWLVNNAKQAHSYGIELETKYYLTDEITLNSSFGITKAIYDDFDAGSTNLKGKEIENTPKYKLNLSLNYQKDNGVYTNASIYSRGSTKYYDTSNQNFLKSNSATTLNFKIGYMFQNWDIYTFVNNVTDKRYVTGYSSKGTLSSVSYNQERFVGLGISYKF